MFEFHRGLLPNRYELTGKALSLEVFYLQGWEFFLSMGIYWLCVLLDDIHVITWAWEGLGISLFLLERLSLEVLMYIFIYIIFTLWTQPQGRRMSSKRMHGKLLLGLYYLNSITQDTFWSLCLSLIHIWRCRRRG